MKKILISLVVITAVAAAVVSATTSFFSDVQTSTGNVFTFNGIDLKIDNTQYYNGNECKNTAIANATPVYQWVGNAPDPVPGTSCTGTWAIKRLTGEKFFDFGNIMPGDSGENTVSLHVYDNNAWMCADITNVKNDDDAIGTDLEKVVDLTRGEGNGEAAQNMTFFAWADDGDNVFEAGEVVYTPSPVSGTELLNGNLKLVIADSTTGVPVAAGQARYVGLVWCAGAIVVSGTTISCDGSTVGNEAQTDSMTADITFRIEQSKNNAEFKCGDLAGTPTSPSPIPLLTDGFGTSASSSNDISGWNEEGTDSDPTTLVQVAGSGDDGVSPDGGRFAKIGVEEWMCRQITATNYNSLKLKYYWRGDGDAVDNESGIVEYRPGSSCDAISDWTIAATHELDDGDINTTSWSSLQEFDLPNSLNGTIFSIRLRNLSSDGGVGIKHFRIDGVSLTGIAN